MICEFLNASTKISVVIAVGLLVSAFAVAPSSSEAAETPKLPSRAEIENAMQRSFGYDPSVTWNILDIRESAIPELVDVLVSMNKNTPQHIYFSERNHYAVVGEMMPFGSNPYAAARVKLETADGPTRGAKTSEIAIIEFSDFQCANCKAARVQLDKLASEFPQIKYVFQQFPLPASLHPWAFKAAAFTDCASQISKDAFWNYSRRIFEAQAAISAATSSTALKDLAAASGLNGEKLAACAVKPDTEARIRKSLELGRSLDVNQVPTVFMNGRRVLSIASISYDNLRALVRFEIDHAGR